MGIDFVRGGKLYDCLKLVHLSILGGRIVVISLSIIIQDIVSEPQPM